MIEHTVTFRLRHAEGSAEKQAFVAAAREVVTIPDVRDFSIRRQLSPKSDHTFGITMRFESPAAYARYNAHPVHAAFIRDYWLPDVVAFQEADFVPVEMTT